MEKNNQLISLYHARLVMGFLQNSLTETQKDELDDWICESDENMIVFEDLTEDFDNNVFNPEEFMYETSDVIELWAIAGLIVRQQEKVITVEEQQILDTWLKDSARNRRLFKHLQNPPVLQKLIEWCKVERNILLRLN
ncbi:hypothetical protein [Terrimonas pollutisoli]|uniref:hypothetical protein n=1 Tax=Terrimonas pollutisoli TaxID=3034147 RepID=UPI0023EE0DAD|nr:hypothetical protein [Terrimonas sp. H1YJ31]